MLISGNDLKTYKGKLVSVNIGTAGKNAEKQFLTEKSLTPLKILETEYQSIPIKLVVEIQGSSRGEFEYEKGKLTEALNECSITFKDIPDRVYESWLSGEIEVVNDLPEIGTITYNLNSICVGEKKERNFTDTLNFAYEGNMKAPCILTIVTDIALNSLTITGLTKQNITIQNVARDAPLVIDGEACLITQNGTNKFNDSNLWEFPIVKPGENTVKLSTACTAVLAYKPRYI